MDSKEKKVSKKRQNHHTHNQKIGRKYKMEQNKKKYEKNKGGSAIVPKANFSTAISLSLVFPS